MFCENQGGILVGSIERWDKVGGGRGIQEEGDIYIPVADSC